MKPMTGIPETETAPCVLAPVRRSSDVESCADTNAYGVWNAMAIRPFSKLGDTGTTPLPAVPGVAPFRARTLRDPNTSDCATGGGTEPILRTEKPFAVQHARIAEL